jgi:hypothetical protein
MGYDLKRSHFSLVLEKSVSTGSVITEEGVVLVAVLDAATGTETVQMSADAANEVVAGFAIRDNADHATAAEVESVTVPASGDLSVQLRNNNIVIVSGGTPGDGSDANLRVESPPGTALTLVDGVVATDGQAALEPVTGILFFHSDEAGEAAVVTYTYNLTVAESRLKFFQRNINNEASTLFGQVGVGQGHGEIFTDQFDATVDWSLAAAVVHSGVDGILTNADGSSPAMDARVISVPNVNNPLLGVSFDIGGNSGNA